MLGGCALSVVALLTIFNTGESSSPLGAGKGGPDESFSALDGTTAVDSLQMELFGTRVAPEGSRCVIGRNETFYDIMQARGAPHEDIMALVKACRSYRDLGKVKLGDEFLVVQDADGGLRRISFDLDLESYLVFEREGDGFEVLERNYPVERRLAGVSGTIRSSLYASLQDAGAPLSLASKMNDILGWEIDFQRDLREGDTFRIIYEEIWKEGAFVRTGPILALECVNRQQPHRAFRFTDADDRPGYYDPEGANLQKQLLRAPLEYSRISSGFSWRRFHPVLKRYMPHMGVDYAAPVGTPVRAAGDGQIVEAGRKQGNGRYLKIRHTNSAYESYYLHLYQYARGIRKGVTVRQGQVIGYVGASGWATGPHLDFRIKKDGVFVDPRRVKLPPAEPVSDTARPAFALLVDRYARTLDAMSENSLPHALRLTPATPRITLWEPPPSGNRASTVSTETTSGES